MAERSSRLLRPVTEADFGEKQRAGLFSVPDLLARRTEQLRRQLQQSNTALKRAVKTGKAEDFQAAFENNPFMGMLGTTGLNRASLFGKSGPSDRLLKDIARTMRRGSAEAKSTILFRNTIKALNPDEQLKVLKFAQRMRK